jgi:hypothetical protein
MLNFMLSLVCKPTAEELAQREHEESRRHLLEAQRMRDYYEKMVEFHTTRVSRTRSVIRSGAE